MLNTVVRPWVAGRTVELLGEEEASIIDFVMGKVRQRSSAADIARELRQVLEEDAQAFVEALSALLVQHGVA